jgi:hypothetical protein
MHSGHRNGNTIPTLPSLEGEGSHAALTERPPVDDKRATGALTFPLSRLR